MTTLILSLIGALGTGGLITGLLVHKRESPKAKAEAAEIIASAALKIVQSLEGRVAALEFREFEFLSYVESLRAHINAGNPPPPPPWPDTLKRKP